MYNIGTRKLKKSIVCSILVLGIVGGILVQLLYPSQESASSNVPILIVTMIYIFIWYYLDSKDLKYK